MTSPRLHALGLMQQGSPTRWKATGSVAGVGWLEAWGLRWQRYTASDLSDFSSQPHTHDSRIGP
jgi:hypothetical protein